MMITPGHTASQALIPVMIILRHIHVLRPNKNQVESARSPCSILASLKKWTQPSEEYRLAPVVCLLSCMQDLLPERSGQLQRQLRVPRN